MTKRELFKEYQALLDTRGLYKITDVNSNSNKATLQNAIDCLKVDDEEITLMLKKLSAVLPATVRTILQVNYLASGWHRLHIYNSYNLYKNELK